MMWGELGALLTVFLVGAQTAPLSSGGLRDCHELKPQTSIDLDKLMGDWYAVETVDHNTPVEPNTVNTVVGTCPILELTREDNKTIRLQWNEKAGVLVYRFNQPKTKQPGFWESAGYQDGSLAGRVQFSGTVQVMKAVNSHMVLTFCSRTDYNKYSVIMSRTRRLPLSDLRGVKNMLINRGLVQGQVKGMCKGVATASRGCLGVFMLILVAKFIIVWP